MSWMAERHSERSSPTRLWPDVRSVLMVGVNYGNIPDPLAALERRDSATLALYAQRRDYHAVIKGRLKDLAGFLVSRAGGDVKVFVDTAPVMERPLAMVSGIGWQGKNTMLVSRKFGNWLLLGAVFSTLEIEPDVAEPDHCGSCTRCLDRCPTAAFPAPYVLDARRCIAYLTIEHHGPVPAELRPAIGNRVFGCDDCLAVCPWNKFASAAREAKLATQGMLAALPLSELARLDDPAFRSLFAATPVKRLGRDRFLRNVLIAIGNSQDPALAASARARLEDAAPAVRAMAIWALSRLLPAAAFQALAADRSEQEAVAEVRAEWDAALAQSRKPR